MEHFDVSQSLNLIDLVDFGEIKLRNYLGKVKGVLGIDSVVTEGLLENDCANERKVDVSSSEVIVSNCVCVCGDHTRVIVAELLSYRSFLGDFMIAY